MASEIKDDSKGQLVAVLLLALFVLLARMLFEAVIPVFENTGSKNFFEIIGSVIRNYPLALLLIGTDYFLIRFLLKYFPYGQFFIRRTFIEIGALIVLAALSSILMLPSLEVPVNDVDGQIIDRFVTYFIAIFVLNTCIVAFMDALTYSRYRDRVALAAEIKLRAQANYRYSLLKGQLNPHFLFNSLNVLDYLIYTDKEKASDYVKKLANVYRYLLNIETNNIVQLEEELDFVNLYVDLMKERLGDALKVEINIPENYKKRKIVPCTLEVLIENAVKHNISGVNRPLIVNIVTDGNQLVVSNTKNLKPVTPSPGVGLANINKQYEILFESSIQVKETDAEFTVVVPLFK